MRMVRSRYLFASTLLLALTLTQCKTVETADGDAALLSNDQTGGPGAPFVMSLPAITDPAGFKDEVLTLLKRAKVPDRARDDYATRISHYLGFLGVAPGSAEAKAVLSRLMQSSTQFLVCDSIIDWECLESKPAITPSVGYRQDTAEDLGKPVNIPAELKMEMYFTDKWDAALESVDRSEMLAQRLAAKIRGSGADGISMALYGIDDITDSMSPVYDALIERHRQGVQVRGVFDTEGFNKKGGTPRYPLSYTYRKPRAGGNWIFDEAAPGRTNVAFMYNGTARLVQALNDGIDSDDKARARLEWPDNGIMHNKFMVFRDGERLSLWSGTANVANTCMGTERNTNVGITIDNTEVARTFLEEFEEMYGYRQTNFSDGPRLRNYEGGEPVKVGSFHTNKTPNTKRYFRFKDGTEMHVHFAPTDDGEHRVILPLLLAAQPGDQIRVAMFGGGGLELVRAFQYAVAKGADVRLVFDRVTGSNPYSWTKHKAGNLLQKNPYAASPKGNLKVRMSAWKGLNHHKSATVSRRKGTGHVAGALIIGSQNWSQTGNDKNDENMISLIHPVKSLSYAERFNKHFDERLWPAAAAGEIGPGTVLPEPQPGEGGEGDGEGGAPGGG